MEERGAATEKAYMACEGADPANVAEIAVRGVELDIKGDGGAPAFVTAVDLVVFVCEGGERHGRQLLEAVDSMRREFADSPLTRHIAQAAEGIGLSAIIEGRRLSRQEAAEMLLAQIAESRCCNGMSGYITKNRTLNLTETQAIIRSINGELSRTAAISDLATRMLNCSAKGLPAKAAKMQQVRHSAEALNDEEL